MSAIILFLVGAGFLGAAYTMGKLDGYLDRMKEEESERFKP
jgi:hypothetical protein